MRLLPLTFSLTWLAATSAFATPTPEQLEFFEKQVRPVLAEQCFKCHGPEKQKGELRVDSLQALLKGSDQGPVVVPGKPEESSLIKSIKHIGDAKMPEKAPKMPDAQISALEQWVAMGAPWPENDKPATNGAAKAAKEHWSYQPVKTVQVPEVAGAANAIDAFISTKLATAGLTPSPRADKRTLLRRASFTLLGLPPTAEEVATFDSDASPDAFAKAVDRLLESPRYGERWARHWMDVARYADSKGYIGVGVDRSYPFAYTYRDWLIRAFNSDVPYDRFLMLQLAADQMVGPNDPELAAMGFLNVGRRFIGNIHDIIDDRIDTLCRGTMGLTVACARCHDHKFDPVLQRDYYALYGVFNSSIEPEELPKIGEIDDPQALANYERAYAAKKAQFDDFVGGKVRDYALLVTVSTGVPVAVPPLDRDVLRPLMTGKDRERSRELAGELNKVNSTQVSPPRAMVMVDKPQPIEPVIFQRGNPGRPGDPVKRQFIGVLAGEKQQPFTKGSGRLDLAQAIASRDNPLTARHIVNRIWAYHFGKGLVATVGDFGVKGDQPSHPEMLDWLATWFMENGWSLKKLHRLVMLSNTWQQASDRRDDCVAKDPENRLLWRQNRQRLDFEATRDSILFAAGQLDLKMGGKSVDVVNPPYSKRRAVYASIDRQNLPGLFRTFDFPSPDVSNPQRFVTTVPQQALFMLNSPFVVEEARALVGKSDFAKPESASEWQVQELYERVFSRRAEPPEVEAALKFITAEAARTTEAGNDGPAWSYGFGWYDEGTKKVSFTPLPHFADGTWKGSAKVPDEKLGWVLLNREGGHVGNDPQHAAIRRWTAPRDAVLSVIGKVERPAEAGDGIEARIVSSQAGELLKVMLDPKGAAETKLDGVQVKAGDTLDFIASCRANENSDGFNWMVTLRTDGGEWDSRKEFAGPPPPRSNPLTPWEKYAQVLLQANEFVFVD
jgi:mono/diheme cytochrome c family protein